MMLNNWIRGLAFAAGALMALGGFAAASTGAGAAGEIWTIIIGAGVMIVAVVQRPRYRSNEAESSHEDPGPGGGENDYLEPRFLPTTELFVDPTSQRLMRVFVDPRTGERRYRAEG
jgi:hypothetical protein